ncbi:hypothetical protein BT96DRAFT_991411 [Gymnopus androsaceus JB14]|uniref:DUF6534 domain-containing protein n=1 Tax=Gymnopus androsaceus JB14 TaxID=1447944 RepID=A0A6A4HZW2_9AGAR|nr:hypothetical protein BT96DRAFT_991411 [Gymnopus androsaceus JB14]
MSAGLSAAEQAQIDIVLGGVVVSNYLSYLTMGIVLCASMWTYDWAVANYGNPTIMAFLPWALPTEGFLMATCGLTVQLFFALRIWMMSMRKNWILPVVIGCLSILGWCMLCWTTHIAATHKSISDIMLARPAGHIWLGGSVCADVLITGSMIYYLDLRFRMKPLFPSSISANRSLHRRLRKLIVRTVECNVLSLLVQTVSIGLFNRSNVGFYFVVPNMTMAKIFTFSLLVSLNSRHTDNDYGTSQRGSSSRGDRGVELTVLHTSSIPSTQVSAHTQRETAGDLEEQAQRPMFNHDRYDTHVVISPHPSTESLHFIHRLYLPQCISNPSFPFAALAIALAVNGAPVDPIYARSNGLVTSNDPEARSELLGSSDIFRREGLVGLSAHLAEKGAKIGAKAVENHEEKKGAHTAADAAGEEAKKKAEKKRRRAKRCTHPPTTPPPTHNNAPALAGTKKPEPKKEEPKKDRRRTQEGGAKKENQEGGAKERGT